MKEENAPAQPTDADLPPQVQADQYLLEAEKALQNNDPKTAKTAFEKIKELPSDFFFLYGKFLMENCNAINLAKAAENGQVQNFLNNLLKARYLLKQFLTQAERNSSIYKSALELLSAGQSTIKAVTPAAKRRAGETFLIHLAACYSELVNTIVSAEDCASSAKIQVASYYSEVVSSLLNAAIDVNADNYDGGTPLHLAADKGQVEVVEALLAAGANVHARNEYDRTPLQVPALLGNTKVVEALLASSANVHAKNKYGETPLYDAAEEGQVEVVKVLVATADTEARNKHGETPLDLARERGKTEVVEILRDSGGELWIASGSSF